MSSVSFDFKKYAGKEIAVIKERVSTQYENPTKIYTSIKYRFDLDHPLTAELLEDAKKAGINVLGPAGMLEGHDPKRVSIRVQSNKQEKYFLVQKLIIG